MPGILSSVACNLDKDILAACLPLMEAGKIEAIEWSFDTLFDNSQTPLWFQELLDAFSKEKRLIGHGVFFSLFSGRWSQEQQQWLAHLKEVATQFDFDHITEHFGFMTGQNFHHGAPLSIPYSKTTLNIGRDRLMRIQDACKRPVGLENLAFSYSLEEVKRHGAFLDQLTEPINGFIILDLHNVFCQTHNFSIPFEDLIALYPLHKVREIHISGGSWEKVTTAADRKIRRDTHDSAVPQEVFEILALTIDRCPHLKYVVLEQLGIALKDESSRALFYSDFLKMEEIVQRKNKTSSFTPENPFLPAQPLPIADWVEDESLAIQQSSLSYILENATSYENAMAALRASPLAHSAWEIERWTPYMLETALHIAQKWKK